MPSLHTDSHSGTAPIFNIMRRSSAEMSAILHIPTRSDYGNAMKTQPYLSLSLILLLVAFLATGCGSRNASEPLYGNMRHATDLPPSQKSSAIVKTAKAATGVPYHWGGCSPNQGFDCSGLVWWSYHENGLSIPRTAAEQAQAGHSADCARLRQGDVLVFTVSSKGLHSGIYSGNGNFVHSPKTGHVVREETLQKDYWLSQLLTCRRIAP